MAQLKPFGLWPRMGPANHVFGVGLDPAGWLGSRVVSVLDSGAEGLGSNRSRDTVLVKQS